MGFYKKNPLIEEQADGTCNLTFVYRGGAEIETLGLLSSLCDPSMVEQGHMQRIDDTDLWYLTVENIPNDARITYQYFRNGEPTPDPLNSLKIDGFYGEADDQYIAELPRAKKQPNAKRARLPGVMEKIMTEGRLIQQKIDFSESRFLGRKEAYMDDTQLEALSPGTLQRDMADVLDDEQLRGIKNEDFRKMTKQGATRDYWVHLPPNYDPDHQPPYRCLVHLDGEETIKCMKLPAIMDTAMSAEENPLEPTISVFIDVGNRNIEYGCGEDAELFADFLATELMPKLRDDYPSMSRLQRDTTIAGYSMGGHAATQIATRHPEVFGNVVAQSSSFWMGAQNPVSGKFESENEGLLKKLQDKGFPESGAAKELCFYLNVGSFETAGFHLTPSGNGSPGGTRHDITNEHFADFLKSRGIACEFDIYTGDHCFAEWQELVIEGLTKTRQLQMAAPLAEEAGETEDTVEENTATDTDVLSVASIVTQQLRDKLLKMKQDTPGYMAPTESSKAKERGKYSPLETTPKPPWK